MSAFAAERQFLTTRLLLQGRRIVSAFDPPVRRRCSRRHRSRGGGRIRWADYFRIVRDVARVARPATSATGSIRTSLGYRLTGLQGDNSSRLRTSDSVCARLRIPHAVVPAVAECETNQGSIFRMHVVLARDSMRLDGPGRDRTSCWFTLAFLSCIATPCCPTKSKAAQGRPRMTIG